MGMGALIWKHGDTLIGIKPEAEQNNMYRGIPFKLLKLFVCVKPYICSRLEKSQEGSIHILPLTLFPLEMGFRIR